LLEHPKVAAATTQAVRPNVMAAKAEKMRQMAYDENSKRCIMGNQQPIFFSLKETGSTTKHETAY
jgi:hypothetical protein